MDDASKPAVRAWPYGRGYQGHFRKPGGSWQFVRAADNKSPAVFPTTEAAKDAARELIFAFMCPPIRSSDPKQDNDVLAAKMTEQFAGWKAERDQERQRERREVFRGMGKGFVQVETIRRRS